jgi:hypothetical protein
MRKFVGWTQIDNGALSGGEWAVEREGSRGANAPMSNSQSELIFRRQAIPDSENAAIEKGRIIAFFPGSSMLIRCFKQERTLPNRKIGAIFTVALHPIVGDHWCIYLQKHILQSP